MIVWLIAIVGVIAFIIPFLDGWYSLVEKILYGFVFSFIGAFLTLLILLLPYLLISDLAEKDYELENVQDIEALKDTHSTEGSFFLGSGVIDGDLHYYYTVKEEHGTTVKSSKAKHSFVNETEGVNPNVEIYNPVFKSKILDWVFGDPVAEDKYVFELPSDTVFKGYDIDLE